MTAQSAAYSTDDPAPPEPPQGAPSRAGERSARRCARCGAVGTHYLTCPGLRLPPGYRLSEGGPPEEPSGSGQIVPGPRPVARRHGGGPDHPDWPCPPRQ